MTEQLNFLALDQADQQALFDRGLAVAVPLRAIHRESARLTGALREVIAARTRASARLKEIEIETERRIAVSRELAIRQFRELRQEQFALDHERRALRTKIEGMTIRAPVSGVVYDLRVHTPQSVIRSAEPLLYLIPQDRPLLIAAQVDPSDIGQVRPGQQVTVLISTTDQNDTPKMVGRVRRVSADTREDPRTGLRRFHVEITLSEQELARINSDKTLRLGMPVEVFIILEERTPMAFLLKPIADYFARAFRES